MYVAPVIVRDGERIVYMAKAWHACGRLNRESLPETATAIDPPFEIAINDWQPKGILVLDQADAHMVSGDRRDVGAYAAFLCSHATVTQIKNVLRDAALAAYAADKTRAYDLAWRVVRCATSYRDIEMAAQMLDDEYSDAADCLRTGYRL
jgi:hypothetical protein